MRIFEQTSAMNSPGSTSYDEVPYVSVAYPQSHPDRLATVATLFGMTPPPVESCRVLELGCASGGNLLPMACALPGARFVGVDLSQRAIADGRRAIEELALKNIELHALSIADVGEEFGDFDYVISHGVFSWVPHEVQDKILGLCSRQLAPNGVAYISYNTYPGWHLRGMIRDMMRFHAQHFDRTEQRVQQARALLDFLAENTREEDPYGLALRKELELIRKADDSYLLHEHLEDVNEPLYFHEFAARAAGHGLRYLGEADVHAMAAHSFSAEVQATLRRLSANIVQSEQYLDFLRHRTFRQTLLCHQAASLSRSVPGERIAAFHVASPAQPIDGDGEFRGPHGAKLKTTHPLMRAAMLHLGAQWPRAIGFAELLRAIGVADSDPELPGRVTRELGERLLRCYTASKLVELHLTRPCYLVEVSGQPLASAYARWQAATRNDVTNLRHEGVLLCEAERRVLVQLDGTRAATNFDADTLMRFARVALLVG